jgi:hypothetical protein
MLALRRTSVAMALALAALSTPAPALAAPPTTAFTYQGELKENGQAVTASLPMTFRLFNAATGGTQLGQISKPAVAVEGGRFTEPLAFPAATFNSAQVLWLEVVVNGVTLTERQQITGSAYSLSTRGITVDAQNRVGVGTTAPSRKLSVVGGMDIYDGAGEGVSLCSNSLTFADASEDTFYRFSGATQSHVFSTNGGDCVTIDGAGRMGVGTMSPTAKLHVTAPAGDSSVKLPDSSIGNAELAAEPGLAAIRYEHMVSLGSELYNVYLVKTVMTRTINVPANGYLVVTGTGRLISDRACTFTLRLDGVQQGGGDMFSPASGSGAVAQIRVIPVTAGEHSVAWMSYTDVCDILNPSLTVMYFPTAYGEVTLP